jgi:hypothetical protein
VLATLLYSLLTNAGPDDILSAYSCAVTAAYCEGGSKIFCPRIYSTDAATNGKPIGRALFYRQGRCVLCLNVGTAMMCLTIRCALVCELPVLALRLCVKEQRCGAHTHFLRVGISAVEFSLCSLSVFVGRLS